MTTLYRPVLIETAEEAEALPMGTVAIRLDDEGRVWTANRRCRCEAKDCAAWFSTDDDQVDNHAHMVGATALVPIEAEEETRVDPEVFAELETRLAYTQATYALPPGELQVRHVRRYVTPWQRFTSPKETP